jgi:outer membrane protein insertion porin family
MPSHRTARLILAGLLLSAFAAPAGAQAVNPENHPIFEVRVEGLKQVPKSLVLNQIRLKKGEPFQRKVSEEDIVRITHLGRFTSVKSTVMPRDDGSVVVTYVVVEQPLLADVQVVGNKAKGEGLSDQELLSLVVLRAGDPVDQALIDRGAREIKRAYEKQGYFLCEVNVDQKLLDESGILIYNIREGPLVKIRDIRFEGNKSFLSDQLYAQIQSRTAILIFRKGELNRELLDGDAARIRQFYQDRGYLDAQVGRRIDLSEDQKDAVVVFFIEEGRRYTVDKVRVEGNQIFSGQQVMRAMALKPGSVFAADDLRKSQQAVIDLYGKLGFLATQVTIDRLFHMEQGDAKVDLVVRVEEGVPYLVGNILVRGNKLTKDKVVLRQVRGLEPGRRFDRTGLDVTQRRLRESSLFSEANVTVLGDPDDEVRDVLIEVKEQNTGSLSFGAGISSDAGVIGAIDLVQRNFDIADWPDSLGEFFTGRAFRGAGQSFSIGLAPGNRFSRYGFNFREPYLFDSAFFLDTDFRYYSRVREDWDERRLGGTVGLGYRLSDVWAVRLTGRGEVVDVKNIDRGAPIDVFDVAGESLITSLGVAVTRSTTDSRIFPTRGSRLTLGVSRAGVLGGDYDFTKATASFNKFWAVDEDFFGRKTVLSLNMDTGYILENDQAPIFERFYAGGHRSLRGFRFRGVGPRGIRASNGKVGSDPVGGDWLFLAGLEYNWPIFQEIVRGVVFVDSGTVQQDVGFDEYRVAVGAGIRLKIPFLGQAPFALDFAYPLVKRDGDETQLFSFDLALPF